MKDIIIGFIVGIIINKIVIRPIERRYWREKCFNEGLVKRSDSE
jgi:hypothetical protein